MKLLVFFISSLMISHAYGREKTYFKSPTFRHLMERELSFGLTKKQKDQIANLTSNEVDFREIFIARNFSFFNLTPPHVRELDPETRNDHWQEALGVTKAWEMATGKGVTIADCDAGFFHDEEDLLPNLLLTHARDFSNTDDPFTINDGTKIFHGTAVASIMIGVLDGRGINGISPDAKLIPLQNYNYNWALDKKDKEEATTECILHALKIPQVKIILLENQTQGSSETFIGTREAVKLALKSGVTIVSTAGNLNNELVTEERFDTGSIIVGAVNELGQKESSSNYGKRVSVSAYGHGVSALMYPNGGIGLFTGTSAAAPQVASTVALMLEVNPKLTPLQIKNILVTTRKTTKENEKVGGLLNLVEAVKKAKSTKPDHQGFQDQAKFRETVLSILRR